jgi:hypothetical protein
MRGQERSAVYWRISWTLLEFFALIQELNFVRCSKESESMVFLIDSLGARQNFDTLPSFASR